jgi:hypothetical protein
MANIMVFFRDTTIALKNHLLNTGADCKSNILTDKLVEIFEADKLNLARIKFISIFIALSNCANS